jgi:hypothetical protein
MDFPNETFEELDGRLEFALVPLRLNALDRLEQRILREPPGPDFERYWTLLVRSASDPQIRDGACRIFTTLLEREPTTQAWVDRLLPLLQHSSELVRSLAVGCLGKLLTADAALLGLNLGRVTGLLQTQAQQPPPVQVSALGLLQTLASSDETLVATHITVFTGLLGSPEPSVRSAATSALPALLTTARLVLHHTGGVLHVAEQDPDPGVRAAALSCAVRLLGSHSRVVGRFLDTIAARLEDPDEGVRRHAVMALGHLCYRCGRTNTRTDDRSSSRAGDSLPPGGDSPESALTGTGATEGEDEGGGSSQAGGGEAAVDSPPAASGVEIVRGLSLGASSGALHEALQASPGGGGLWGHALELARARWNHPDPQVRGAATEAVGAVLGASPDEGLLRRHLPLLTDRLQLQAPEADTDTDTQVWALRALGHVLNTPERAESLGTGLATALLRSHDAGRRRLGLELLLLLLRALVGTDPRRRYFDGYGPPGGGAARWVVVVASSLLTSGPTSSRGGAPRGTARRHWCRSLGGGTGSSPSPTWPTLTRKCAGRPSTSSGGLSRPTRATTTSSSNRWPSSTPLWRTGTRGCRRWRGVYSASLGPWLGLERGTTCVGFARGVNCVYG